MGYAEECCGKQNHHIRGQPGGERKGIMGEVSSVAKNAEGLAEHSNQPMKEDKENRVCIIQAQELKQMLTFVL